ncbi:FAD:protein FMN transferase [Motiliproteus sp. MSK22-1]|uniref:FAD:protein FMN transferase n=1 Tax=Motiliproteus sp. MSK22-1 TaxID=1897630 RepID=UPI001E3D48D3|nr:FAD:protein FMN transferase [Motiliproteus sp. MSK22-1]
MGSPCEVQLYLSSADMDIFDILEREIKRLEGKYSRYQETSVVSNINRVAKLGGQLTVDSETAAILQFADHCFQSSSGLFDITTGVLRNAWNFKTGIKPASCKLNKYLSLVGWKKLHWQNSRLSFPEPGMELDFGGIVKEYAVDALVTLCRTAGIESGIIDLGGDIAVLGPHPDGSPWMIGIRHPRKNNQPILKIPVKQGCIATSGDYERYFEKEGQRYCHLLNPLTGQPAMELQSVSVIANLCVIAGMASTTSMLMGESLAKEWLDSLNLPYCLINKSGLLTSTG